MINNNRPIVLTIAASDSAGMAGIQMDIKVQSAFNVHSMSVLTAATAQNNQTVLSLNCVDKNVLEAQLKALEDFPISVVKIGLIGNAEQVKVITKFVSENKLSMVLDPVVYSSSGTEMFDKENIELLVNDLIPLCNLITPNISEAALLTRLPVSTFDEMKIAATKLINLGAKNVLIKGGHLSAQLAQDFFLGEEKSFWLSSEKQKVNNCRGTGCALASAIASSLSLNYSMYDSIVIGKMAINQGLRESYSVAAESGPVSINRFPDQEVDLPILSAEPIINFNRAEFPQCNQPKLGLYPIVDRAEWIARLAPEGVTTIQLRIKDLTGELLEREIKDAIEVARKYRCRLFINDFWQLAIKYSAYGVHLGQEDIDLADIEAIHKAGLRLGLSSHCHYEVARAIGYKPSYIACGPVYHTNTKQMPWLPQGIKGLSYWRNLLNYPLVAIGGINERRIKRVVNVGVDSVAMISAITEAENPEVLTRKLLAEYF
jgi:hydroxymethylpyrimidine kinase / phosphomethylpyrimidine kinase / thiamine-phosphate diphosphorylase